jgi:tRNA nucleotidyltransferase (CCA-adding enzyme)
MVHRAEQLRPKKLLELLVNLDALRRTERFEEILIACEMDATGRTGKANTPYPSAAYLRAARTIVCAVDIREVTAKALGGEALRAEIDRLRQNALRNNLKN